MCQVDFFVMIECLIYPQELNVRKITVSSDKQKFGVQLRAEPDNQTLGRRLKGAFKQVSQAIKGILYQSLRLTPSVEYLLGFVHVISYCIDYFVWFFD